MQGRERFPARPFQPPHPGKAATGHPWGRPHRHTELQVGRTSPLIVVLKPGQPTTEEELLEFLRDRVAKWWLPDQVAFVSELPHTAAGDPQAAFAGTLPRSLFGPVSQTGELPCLLDWGGFGRRQMIRLSRVMDDEVNPAIQSERWLIGNDR